MLAILSSEEIRQLDSDTIREKGISSIDLMEHASSVLIDHLLAKFEFDSIAIVCGPGNNGGDGLAVARMLAKKKSIVVYSSESLKHSEDFEINLERVKKMKLEIREFSEFKESECDLVLDALFGSGLDRPLSGKYKSIVNAINRSTALVVSVDMPSGMPVEPIFNLELDSCVKSDYVYTFQHPKLSLLLPYSDGFYSQFEILDIGLVEYNGNSNLWYIQNTDVSQKVMKDSKFSHKYQRGSLLIAGGSKGKTGSIALSSEAAFRTGCGVVTAFIPQCVIPIFQNSLAEAMYIDSGEDFLIRKVFDHSRYDAYGIGPGMSVNQQTSAALSHLLSHSKPSVIDADGLRIIAEYNKHNEINDASAILTPHEGEFKALVGEWSTDKEKLEMLKNYAELHSCVIVLKGAHTIICDGQNLYFNSNGDPAMATAGSGDVLLGIISSLRAQNYSALDSALIGVYLHSLAAEIYLKRNVSLSLVASDIVKSIGTALKELTPTKF